MKPEVVLRYREGNDLDALCREWNKAYQEIAEEFQDKGGLCAMLSARVAQAASLLCQRQTQPAAADDSQSLAADAALDGPFPLGKEADAVFASSVFPVSDLAMLQCGLPHLIETGTYSEPNDAVLIRMGIVAEQKGAWLAAADCYAGVACSQTVQDREYFCRKKAELEGERLYALAKSHIAEGDEGDVYYLLTCAAEMGNAEAETELGLADAYAHFGATHCLEDALLHLRNAAQKNCVRACLAFSALLDSGEQMDAAEAMQWCQKAAELGSEAAKARLRNGFVCRSPREQLQERIDAGEIDALWEMEKLCELEGELEEAGDWYEKALAADQLDAILATAEVYDEEGSELYDAEQALFYYRKAAEHGAIKAMFVLGDKEIEPGIASFHEIAALLYDTDAKMKKPDKKTRAQHEKQFMWYLRAAESGDIGAMDAVLTAYHYGYPGRQDDAQAFLWASRAADAGDAYAMYWSACFFEAGRGVTKDVDAAILLYIEAAEKGYQPAILRLYQIYKDGIGVPADAQKAARYLFLSGVGRD